MNKQRRKAIGELHEQISAIMEQLDELKDEEQEAYDNTPESLQESERGQAMEEAINQME